MRDSRYMRSRYVNWSRYELEQVCVSQSALEQVCVSQSALETRSRYGGAGMRLTICAGKVIDHGGLPDFQYCFPRLNYRVMAVKGFVRIAESRPPETLRDRSQEI